MSAAVFLEAYQILTLSITMLFLYQLLLEFASARSGVDRSQIARRLRPMLVCGAIYSLFCYLGAVDLTESLSALLFLGAPLLGPLCFYFYSRLLANWFEVKLPYFRVFVTLLVVYSVFKLAMFADVYVLGSWLGVDSLFHTVGSGASSSNIYMGNSPLIVPLLDFEKPLIAALGLFNVLYSFIFLRKALNASEWGLASGIVFNFLFVFNDVLFVTLEWAYLVPLSFLSYLLEGILITLTVYRETYRRNLELEGDVIEVSKVAEIGAMAGQICHDIRNPLSVAKGALYLIRRKSADTQPNAEADTHSRQDGLDKNFDRLERSLDRIESIVSDYLVMMRSDVNEPQNKFSVEAIVNSALELAEPKFMSSHVKMRSVVCPPEAIVLGHESRLVMALVNLLANAADELRGHEDPWVSIEVKRSDQKIWEIRVTDSGKGIPEHIARKLFLKKVTTKERGKGTGLGLQFVAKVAENYGGYARLDRSCPHTTFVIGLPAAEGSGDGLESTQQRAS